MKGALSNQQTLRLKYAVELRRARVEGPDSDRPYVGLENIESRTGRLIPSATTGAAEGEFVSTSGESLSALFEEGDILFGKLRPYLAKAWIAEFNGRCSTELLPLRPEKIHPRFGLYIVLSQQFIDAVDASTFGSKMPRADWEFIGNLPIPLPPQQKQSDVVRFLDRETADIDDLIAAKQQLLDLLAEKRRAIVADAVMRGLNPAASLRPSGIDWLGDIPAHWEVERSRWLFRERDERSETGTEEMLTVSHITGVTPRSEKDVNMFEAESTAGYKLCFAGDLAINTLWAWMGAMGIARVDGIVSPAYNVYTPGPRLLPDYVDALVRIPVFAQEVTRYSKGVWSSRLRLYPEGLFETRWPVPPLDEQQQIVEHIAAETAKIDRLRAATEHSITLLKERRGALIAAAVTGQIDIPEAA
ncbi:restriction endonuclease subunit S [Dankookia rubra]|uniref:Restriction endonuclease subunit S n=1 Tax=Dankookia rubra TaxID=1442381 RepID=A0A4R5QJF6_9PROT|nr:restriction endonuclease subunit S [Dankookia rubra]TDH62939.1 restriction endonuclease subunit S [Dankookia rubra]